MRLGNRKGNRKDKQANKQQQAQVGTLEFLIPYSTSFRRKRAPAIVLFFSPAYPTETRVKI